MAVDQSFVERNRASTERIRQLAARLSDEEMLRPVGEHWTVAIALAHLGQLGQLNEQGGWALELQGMFLAAAVAVALFGPGAYSANRK